MEKPRLKNRNHVKCILDCVAGSISAAFRSFLFIWGEIESRDTMHKISGELKINGYVTGYFWNKRRCMRGQFITLVNNGGIGRSIFHGSCTCRLKRKLKKIPTVRQHLRSGLKWMIKCSEAVSGTKTSTLILFLLALHNYAQSVKVQLRNVINKLFRLDIDW